MQHQQDDHGLNPSFQYLRETHEELTHVFYDILTAKDQMHELYALSNLQKLLRLTPCLEALTMTAGIKQTPLFCAINNLLDHSETADKNAKHIANRVHNILTVLKREYGDSAVDKITSMMCFSHYNCNRKPVYETIRDRMEADDKLAPYFIDVISQHGLKCGEDATSERLPYAQRIKAKDLEKTMRPFR